MDLTEVEFSPRFWWRASTDPHHAPWRARYALVYPSRSVYYAEADWCVFTFVMRLSSFLCRMTEEQAESKGSGRVGEGSPAVDADH